MRDHLDSPSGSRGAGFLGWAARLLVGAGTALLVWCVLVLADATVSQRAARRSLEIASHSRAPVSLRSPDATPDVPQPAPFVVRGAAIADLSIPRIQLSAVVLHGSDAQTLRRGPGHLETSSPPGEPGNSVIAGHRDSFFWPLRNVRLGDDIFLGLPRGRRHYRVTSMRVVDPKDVSVLESTDDAILTLITCYPFSVLGPAPFRFVVQAALVDAPADPAFTMAATAQPQLIREPDPGKQAPVTTHVVPDDDALVRAAIERFRLTYNARLLRHDEARPGGALTFETCAIEIAGDLAAATCVAFRPPDAGVSHTWTVTLERADAGWAIRSIQTT